MQCMPSLCEELSSAASRVPGTRSAVLTLALNSAVEGVLLHAKFDAGQRMHGKSMQAIGSSRRSRVPPLGAAEAKHVNGADGPQS